MTARFFYQALSLMALLIGFYELVSYGVDTLSKVIFSVFIGLTILMTFLRQISVNAAVWFFALTAVNTLWLLPFPYFANPGAYLWIDFILIEALLVFCLLMRGGEKYFQNYYHLGGYLAIALCLQFTFMVIGTNIAGNRFSPISIFFFAWFLFWAHKESKNGSVAYYLIVLLILITTYFSGERTSIILFVIILAAFNITVFFRHKLLTSTIFCIAAFVFALYFQSILNIILQSRFERILSGELDGSLVQRVNEVLDVMTFFKDNAGVLEYFSGFGHGAMFYPVFSFSEANLLPNGMVHHVHATPVLIFFRYGAIGLFFILWLFLSVGKRLLVMNQLPEFERFVVVLTSAYLINSLMRNVLVDPFFLITISMYFQVRRGNYNAS